MPRGPRQAHEPEAGNRRGDTAFVPGPTGRTDGVRNQPLEARPVAGAPDDVRHIEYTVVGQAGPAVLNTGDAGNPSDARGAQGRRGLPDQRGRAIRPAPQEPSERSGWNSAAEPQPPHCPAARQRDRNRSGAATGHPYLVFADEVHGDVGARRTRADDQDRPRPRVVRPSVLRRVQLPDGRIELGGERGYPWRAECAGRPDHRLGFDHRAVVDGEQMDPVGHGVRFNCDAGAHRKRMVLSARLRRGTEGRTALVRAGKYRGRASRCGAGRRPPSAHRDPSVHPPPTPRSVHARIRRSRRASAA